MTVCVKLFQCGTKVSCSLPYAGAGIIFAIRGTQMPESVQSLLRGVGVRGGNANFGVVFLNGTISQNVPEALIRGSVQWSVLEELASEAEIQAALDHAALEQAKRQEEARAVAEAFSVEVQRLKDSPEFAHLVQGDDRYSGVLAAKNIRLIFKAAFPGVKFSVRKTSFGSVGIQWADGPIETEVESASRLFEGGKFCGDEDIYKHQKTPWGDVFGAAEYITLHRDYSIPLIEQAISSVFCNWEGNLVGIERPTVEQFKSGSLYTVNVPGLSDTLQQLIRQTLYHARG